MSATISVKIVSPKGTKQQKTVRIGGKYYKMTSVTRSKPAARALAKAAAKPVAKKASAKSKIIILPKAAAKAKKR